MSFKRDERMSDVARLGLQSMPDDLMKLAKDQFGDHYLQFELWVGHVIDKAFRIGVESASPSVQGGGATRLETLRECKQICNDMDDLGEWGQAASACAAAIQARIEQHIASHTEVVER